MEKNSHGSFENNPDDMPFVFPDFTTDVENKTDIPLGSGTITSLLGKGGMANVYEIWNEDLEVHRAVKLIHPTSTDTERERFDTEIKITAKLHHPFIVEIHGVGKWNGLSYLEMEKIDGITLKEIIKERGALPVPVCTAIGIMICQALQYAHHQEYVIYGKKYNGIIHRDLKPSNIMLCRDGTVKLMDFGIARPTDASFHTMDGTVVGTIHYLPPEQLRGEELDVRTDIYSLAATIYEILTGFRAFPENNLSKLIAEKSKNHYKALHEFNIKVPGDLKNIIHKCMNHNPEKRIPSAESLIKKLEKVHNNFTRETPQEVIKSLVNSRSYEKIIITPRSHLLRNVSIAVACILCIGITIPLIRHYNNFLKLKKSLQSQSDASNQSNVPDPLAKYRDQIDNSEPPEKIKTKRSLEQRHNENTQNNTKSETASQDSVVTRIKTFLDSAMDRYGSDNLMEIITKANRGKEYTDVLRLYDELPEEIKDSKSALIFKLRALSDNNNHTEINNLLSEHTFNDGEYYLAKAKAAFHANDLTKVEELLALSLKIPSELLDRNSLKREVYYYRALHSTVKFDSEPTEENYKKTLGTWHQLKAEMKNNQEHFYYKKAISETQRIGTKYRENKG